MYGLDHRRIDVRFQAASRLTYQIGLFLQCQGGRDVKLPTRLYLVPKLNINEALFPISKMVSYLVLNYEYGQFCIGEDTCAYITQCLVTEYADGFRLISDKQRLSGNYYLIEMYVLVA
jgi:hypothetical protein